MKSFNCIFFIFCFSIGAISSEDVIYKEGQKYITNCILSPKEYLIWTYPNNSRIEEKNKSNRIYTVRDGKELDLIFEFALVKDTGVYQCCNFGDIKNCMQLNIRVVGTPIFEQDYESHQHLVDDDVRLLCQAIGYPYPSYYWLDNYKNKMDDVGENWEISDDTLISNISITSIKKSQEGFFTCVAHNEHGNASKLYLVDVNDRPTSVDLDVETNFITPTSIQFSVGLHKESYSYLVVIFTEEASHKPSKIYWQIGQGQPYLITDLKFNTVYEFKFGVSNDVRLTSILWDKRIYRFQTARNIPNLIIENVTGTTVKIQWPYHNLNDLFGSNAPDYYLLTYVKLKQKSGNFYKSECPMNITIPTCYGRSYTFSGFTPKEYYRIEIRIHYPYGWSDTSAITVYTGA
ncbi:uncharacterized protein LOC111641414 isoform X2 [Centruroides sculpturatus]|uniref:uncharacterized protein LOC111641414 isoform X2 n=1 Tax=Centruroides sculpturatus TaxID=218467 RepID=UPI000C6D4C5E|nr:uncharacterized protein LOC111641414 isoform X2 [Centruroides sculpturatus]